MREALWRMLTLVIPFTVQQQKLFGETMTTAFLPKKVHLDMWWTAEHKLIQDNTNTAKKISQMECDNQKGKWIQDAPYIRGSFFFFIDIDTSLSGEGMLSGPMLISIHAIGGFIMLLCGMIQFNQVLSLLQVSLTRVAVHSKQICADSQMVWILLFNCIVGNVARLLLSCLS